MFKAFIHLSLSLFILSVRSVELTVEDFCNNVDHIQTVFLSYCITAVTENNCNQDCSNLFWSFGGTIDPEMLECFPEALQGLIEPNVPVIRAACEPQPETTISPYEILNLTIGTTATPSNGTSNSTATPSNGTSPNATTDSSDSQAASFSCRSDSDSDDAGSSKTEGFYTFLACYVAFIALASISSIFYCICSPRQKIKKLDSNDHIKIIDQKSLEMQRPAEGTIEEKRTPAAEESMFGQILGHQNTFTPTSPSWPFFIFSILGLLTAATLLLTANVVTDAEILYSANSPVFGSTTDESFYAFTILGGARDTWEVNGIFLSIFIVVWSGTWPWVKCVFLAWVYSFDFKWKNTLASFMAFFGKWGMVDWFIVVNGIVALEERAHLVINNVDYGYFDITWDILPGMYSFLAAIVLMEFLVEVVLEHPPEQKGISVWQFVLIMTMSVIGLVCLGFGLTLDILEVRRTFDFAVCMPNTPQLDIDLKESYKYSVFDSIELMGKKEHREFAVMFCYLLVLAGPIILSICTMLWAFTACFWREYAPVSKWGSWLWLTWSCLDMYIVSMVIFLFQVDKVADELNTEDEIKDYGRIEISGHVMPGFWPLLVACIMQTASYYLMYFFTREEENEKKTKEYSENYSNIRE